MKCNSPVDYHSRRGFFAENESILPKSYSLYATRSENILLPDIKYGNLQPYQAMIRHFTDVNACTANDLRTTFHGYDPENVPPEHIDYCFIDSAVKPVNQVIITDTVDGKYPSDHFGLHIQLEL